MPPVPPDPPGPPAHLSNLLSFLQGRNFGVQGDSISAVFGNAWQNVVIARTGMNLVSQDARSGRNLTTAFECYGTIHAGTAIGVYNIANSPNSCTGPGQTGNINGQTLAQNLAKVDIEVIELGTNDQNWTLGALGDATTANTFLGNLRWVVETYLQAKTHPAHRARHPAVQHVLHQRRLRPAVRRRHAGLWQEHGHPRHQHVRKRRRQPHQRLQPDHRRAPIPNAFAFANFYGPVIAQGLQQIF